MTLPDLAAYLPHSRTPRFRERVAESLRILDELPKLGAPLVSTSWGKDSAALVHLAQRAWGEAKCLHLASPFRLPGDEAPRSAVPVGDLFELSGSSPEEYLAWVRDVGLPHERSVSGQAAAVQGLKKDPALDFAEENGFAVMVLGMRASENERRRGTSLRTRGHTYKLKRGIWISNPLAWWSPRDVWAYIASEGVPYNRRIYDAETHGLTRETIRNTGVFSTDGASERGRIAWLRLHFPAEFASLSRLFPEMTSYA